MTTCALGGKTATTTTYTEILTTMPIPRMSVWHLPWRSYPQRPERSLSDENKRRSCVDSTSKRRRMPILSNTCERPIKLVARLPALMASRRGATRAVARLRTVNSREVAPVEMPRSRKANHAAVQEKSNLQQFLHRVNLKPRHPPEKNSRLGRKLEDPDFEMQWKK